MFPGRIQNNDFLYSIQTQEFTYVFEVNEKSGKERARTFLLLVDL
jgi:hypothetical protein